MFGPFKRQKDSAVGSTRSGKTKILPLDQAQETPFLLLLIALMSFLASVCGFGYIAMNKITQNWKSGLENRATIEISILGEDGQALTEQEIDSKKQRADSLLENYPGLISYEILDGGAIQDIVSPWLGDSLKNSDIPLPVLINLDYEDHMDIESFSETLSNTIPGATLDTHQQWLKQIVSLSSVFEISALFLCLLIGFIIFAAVTGAIQSSIAVHQDKIELLHLMGAQDLYITKLFQAHILTLLGKAGLTGTLLASFFIYILQNLFQDPDDVTALSFSFTFMNYVSILIIPILLCIIGVWTARVNVFRALKEMP